MFKIKCFLKELKLSDSPHLYLEYECIIIYFNVSYFHKITLIGINKLI